MPGMSPRIKAKKGRFGADGLPPSITITLPSDGFTSVSNASFPASATAIDPELGDVSINVVWTSSQEAGTLATGSNVSIILVSVTEHKLTATITVGPHVVTDSITVTVT